MKCEKCNAREATTHLTTIVNGYKEEYHLCAQCASSSAEYKEIQSGMNLGIGDFLTGVLGGKKQGAAADGDTGVCPTCSMPYSEFLNKGKLGCGDCYATFKNKLARPLKQIHGATEHIGKAPVRGGGDIMLGKKLSALEAELNSAVLKQDFERAVILRDEINALKNSKEKEV